VNLPRPVDPARPSERRVPPPPPAKARVEAREQNQDVLASVRIDARGEVHSSAGGDEQLGQLVAYVSRIASLVQADFALDPFDALHAELAGKRVLIYQEGDALIGLVMKPSSAAQELRQKLGV
ncbi:MAG TPA: hypothetical protein VFX59_07555, partial [Polyangiales bacterium]|nr:hypothetical protein [Polyangiales bacterium]